MVRPRRAARSGFTIIELMIALCVIGIMAATIAPSLTELLADNRASAAAMDVVRLARQTRAQAIATGTAQLMRFLGGGTDEVSGFGLGTIRVYAGMNTKCRQTPWSATFTPAAGSGLGPSTLFHMADYNPTKSGSGIGSSTPPRAEDNGRHVIVLLAQIGAEAAALQTDLRVCYQPNGDVYIGTDQVPLLIQTQPILFSVRRTLDTGDGDVQRGRVRQILLPVGGNARLR